MSINKFKLTNWEPLKIQEGLSEYRLKTSFEKEIKSFENNVIFGGEDYISSFVRFRFRNWFVHVHNSVLKKFYEEFKYYIVGDILNYNNLINLLIMVKNAGDEFRDILVRNLSYIDRWTILDTGSTDNTIEIIKDVLKDKKGVLYQEPFINFRDSRNRLLELAGDVCAFNVMLDDTYVIQGDLQSFLEYIRGDDIADSFSITIEGDNTLYSSNRITKPERGLKYENIVHEIIQSENNLNAMIPYSIARIIDLYSDYMNIRTNQRKQQDIDLLFQTLEEKPNDPRTIFYIAQSYICMKDWNNAIYWFKERVKIPGGYKEEIQDSLYYIATISNFYLNVEWETCLKLYLDCYNSNKKRSESLYFIGSHYLRTGDHNKAYDYLKKAYDLGMPEITLSVRKNIYKYHIPKDLILLCYEKQQYQLGIDCCITVLEQDKDNLIVQKWYTIFSLILQSSVNKKKIVKSFKEIIVFVSDGGWSNWDGEILYTKGLGGSETFTIKYSETLVKFGYDVIVFCKCDEEKIYNGVVYLPISNYINFIGKYEIDYCIINRYPEYIPVTLHNDVKNVYYIMHDLCGGDEIIPLDTRLRGIFCISEWHKKYFLNIFPVFKNRTHVVSYGLDLNLFPETEKVKYSFIYPSFPNRGLLELLKMFPRIVKRYPEAKLNIFCNMEHDWVKKHWKDNIEKIKVLIEEQKENVINHGWVNFFELKKYWVKSHIWFYPCTFQETCCLTAYEAAASKCLVVSNNLAALEESIGDRGIIIQGDASESEWQEKALNKLFDVLDENDKTDCIERNYNWVKTKNFDKVVLDFTKYFNKFNLSSN